MTAEISSLPTVLDAPRAELARLCRQIWVERQRSGQTAPVTESEFQQALSEIHTQFGADAISDEDLWEIVRVEEKRVTDAFVLAELLLPRLLTALRTKLPGPTSPSLAPLPTASPEPRAAAPATPLGIADLLEGMLDQQRSELRSRPSPRRS